MLRKICRRSVDDLGRIVLPQELMKENNIESGDLVDIITDENKDIIIRKTYECCVICKRTENLLPVLGKSICISCKAIIKEK